MSVAEFPRFDQDEPVGLVPPQDLLAEQSALGAMLLSKDAIADVIETLRETDFYKPAHATVFAAIMYLYGRGEPADAITVTEQLKKAGTLSNVGGPAYLHTLVASVPTAANASYYARIVSEKATLRRLVEAGTRITQMGYSEQGEVDSLVDRAQSEIYDVAGRRAGSDYVQLNELLNETLLELESIEGSGGALPGVPTGFTELDAKTHGLHAGQMVIIAARPGMGKSTLGLDIVRSAAIKNNQTAAFFSLEMSRTEIVMRLLSAESGVGLSRMRAGNLDTADWDRLARKMSQISNAPLFIDDSPNLTMAEIRAKARRLATQHNLKLLVIDYMQLMSSGRKVESRQVEVSEFSRSIKLLAKELNVPIIAISQLNRGPEQRQDKRPMLSDLRESGSLEQDADMVLLINREMGPDRDPARAMDAQIILAKHRNGPTGEFTVVFQGHLARFAEMAQG